MKGDMFTKRNIWQHTPVIHVDTAVSVAFPWANAHVDMEYMCTLTGLSEEKYGLRALSFKSLYRGKRAQSIPDRRRVSVR